MKLKLSTKLVGGFLIVGLITLISGLLILQNVSTLKAETTNLATITTDLGGDKLDALKALALVESSMLQVQVATRSLLIPGLSMDKTKELNKKFFAAKEEFEKSKELFTKIEQKNQEIPIAWNAFVKSSDQAFNTIDTLMKYLEDFQSLAISNPDKLRANIELFIGDHYKAEAKVLRSISDGVSFEGGTDPAKCNFGKWLKSFSTENKDIADLIQEAKDEHDHFHKDVGVIEDNVKMNKPKVAMTTYTDGMSPSARQVFANLRKLQAIAAKAQDFYNKANVLSLNEYEVRRTQAWADLSVVAAALKKDVDQTVQNADNISDKAKTSAETAMYLTAVSITLSIIIGLAFGITLSLAVSKALNSVIASLNEAGEQVSSASNQISSASQSLAEGATEQAASLEESSSALEEMASMTRQNADNSVNANDMMSKTLNQVTDGAQAVNKMAGAMSEINDSSEQISRIIKTIEEIAFQTNLLALNAAVEAARAGDAGKGFAVVADEVRNLAQRSAQAARDTAELIESTVARVKNGTEIVDLLQTSFGEVETAANGVAGLISNISSASNEQAQGVDQVNTAVAQMDKVTQTNAANAEESASAAEELSAQSEQLKSLVKELMVIVSGNQDKSTHSVNETSYRVLTGNNPKGMHSSFQTKSINKSLTTNSGPKLVKPNEVIPLDDDDDFNDF